MQLFYYITSLTVCQVLFSSFFKKLFQHSRFKMPVIRQPIYYITSFRACQVVFKKVFHLILSEVIFIPSFENLSNFFHSLISSMRFLSFRCRSLTTVIIISHFLRLVNTLSIQSLHLISTTFCIICTRIPKCTKNSTDKPCCINIFIRLLHPQVVQ